VAGTQVTITKNQTLYAHWTAAFNVTWNPNGGKVTPSNMMTAAGGSIGESINVPSGVLTPPALPVATRTGYSNDGWSTVKNGTADVTLNTVPTAAVIYYAHWKANTYTVTFDGNKGQVPTGEGEGTAASITQSVTYDAKFGTLPVPTRDKYKFLGWYTKTSGGTKIAASTKVKITKDTKYYAHWTSAYRVDFNTQSESTIENPAYKMVKKGDGVGTLPKLTLVPEWDYHIFRGWYTKAEKGTKVLTTTIPKPASGQNGVTYYAQWNDAYKVIWDVNADGVTVPEARLVKAGGALGTLPTPKRAGYTFKGWYKTDADGAVPPGEKKITKTTVGIKVADYSADNRDITYHAAWQLKK
jgi:uncharacterized repeat protein (TIGR02543 family)